MNNDSIPAVHSSRLELQPHQSSLSSTPSGPFRKPDVMPSRLTEITPDESPSKRTTSISQVLDHAPTHNRIPTHEVILGNSGHPHRLERSSESCQLDVSSEEKCPLPCIQQWDRRLPPVNWDGILPSEYFEEAELDLHEKQEWIQRDVQELRLVIEGTRASND